jgi:hypothetical protein
MKKLITSLVLSLVALAPARPAIAAYPTQDTPTISTSFRYPKARRVAFIQPERWDNMSLSYSILAAAEYNGLYHIMDVLREQGCDVHLYNTKIFENFQYGTKLWRELGDSYALAVVMMPGGNQAGDVRYICPDSTNIQILAVGGMRANLTASWRDDTTVAGYVDAAQGNLQGPASRGVCLVPYTSSGLGTDTLWASQMPSGRRISDAGLAAMTGVSSVVRVFHPVLGPDMPAGYWAWGTSTFTIDTLYTRMPGASFATPLVPGSNGTSATDSVAREFEYLGPAWKVKYVSGREAWFVKTLSSSSVSNMNPLLIYGMIARFVDVPPIRWAMDFDDVTDAFASTTNPRWRQTAADTMLAAFRDFKVVVGTNGLNPLNVEGYINGFMPPGEDGTLSGTTAMPWVGTNNGHTYIKAIPYNHHSHDSTSARITSNFIGGYGGYASVNGTNPYGTQQNGRRVASRWAPSATGTNYIGAGIRYGILQRLEYGDSVMRAHIPNYRHTPYFTFPANQMLPINWRPRPGTVAAYNPTHTFTVNTSNPDSLCGIDSLLWALDYFLSKGRQTGKGEVVLRAGTISNLRTEALWADRDSVVACMIAQYPRDRFTVRVGGRLIEATVLHSFNQGNGVENPVTARASFFSTAALRANILLGLNNTVNKSEQWQPGYGESFDSDINTLMNFTGSGGKRHFPFRQSVRVLYMHPAGPAQYPSKYGNRAMDAFFIGSHSYWRAIEAVIGREIQQCVPAWQVYAKR